ncbi:DUF5671 domain-containing protein [Ornithinimicrobium kibberense]|uniref:DUF5671 domain-containing protein n=1 Tax=Ornithinimicrobium kibberense TaxID=282060 RepID=A0ABV5V4I5_9MICO|nr:DUF5671 domain-containing protein [Ornithinimicrobium kibberense]
MLGVVSSLVPLALLGGVVAAIVIAVRRRSGTDGHDPQAPEGGGQSVRRFFQYLLLAGLLFAAAAGVTGLLSRLLATDDVLVPDDSQLALELAFTLIALPLWALLTWWTVRRTAADRRELRALGWAAYLTLVGLVSLVVAMVGWHQTLSMLLGTQPYRGGSPALAVVWTLVWAGHHWWGRRGTPRSHLHPLALLGAVAGLATAAAGLARLVAASLDQLTGLGGESLVGRGADSILRPGVTFVVGALVWVVYWVLDLARGRRSTGWLVLVLLVGVGGGLLAATVALSVLAYDVLVWLVGDPAATTASEHFAGAPDLAGVVVVGLLVWWYHQEVLGAGRAAARTEVRRVYEYVMAAVGLLAASAGLVMVIVTLVEAIAAGRDLVVGGSALNALLAALVLLTVGLPVWWWHWRLAQHARADDPAAELASPTRRTYLLVLFGVSGVAAVVALITLVYLLLEDALAGGIDTETMRSIRFPLGILATTSLLSAYHWTVFRADRADLQPRAPARAPHTPAAPGHGPRMVLLVGTLSPAERADLAARTGAEVQLWRPRAAAPRPPSVEELAEAVAAVPEGDLLLLVDATGLRAVPVDHYTSG